MWKAYIEDFGGLFLKAPGNNYRAVKGEGHSKKRLGAGK